MIKYINIDKSFQNQKVLDQFSLTIPPGQIMALMGPSGAGKSVALKLLMGLFQPDSGQILVDSNDITGLSEEQLKPVRCQFGMLFQDAALFDYMNVFENVSFPLYEHTQLSDEEIAHRVNEMLLEVGLTDLNHKLPAELSGGMRKRVGLARALILNPKIILFDEPTTGLDPITTAHIGDLILKTQRARQATVFLISHDIPLTNRVADQVGMLYKGQIVELCAPSQLEQSRHPFVVDYLEAHSTLKGAAR